MRPLLPIAAALASLVATAVPVTSGLNIIELGLVRERL